MSVITPAQPNPRRALVTRGWLGRGARELYEHLGRQLLERTSAGNCSSACVRPATSAAIDDSCRCSIRFLSPRKN